jgi:hypothetical protein
MSTGFSGSLEAQGQPIYLGAGYTALGLLACAGHGPVVRARSPGATGRPEQSWSELLTLISRKGIQAHKLCQAMITFVGDAPREWTAGEDQPPSE